MAPYLCVHVASVQRRGFPFPQSGLSGRRKEGRMSPAGTSLWDGNRNIQEEATVGTHPDLQKTGKKLPLGTQVLMCGGFLYLRNLENISGLRAKTTLFARAQWVGGQSYPADPV